METHAVEPIIRDWKSFRRGCLLGVLLMVVAWVLVWASADILSKPRMFSTGCHGATVTGVMALESLVSAQVMVNDPRDRHWEYAWDSHLPDEVSAVPERDQGPPGFTEYFGDTDDGTHFTLYVRPKGASDWCSMDMHVSWLP